MLTSPHIESTLRPVILPCSLQQQPLQLAVTTINITAKNQAVLLPAVDAHLHGLMRLLHMPMGVVVVIIYHLEQQLNTGEAGV
jgi:hypothetical protein